MDIYLEIFGYIGTALVILSMTMTSLKSLRIFNICGSVISAIYSVIVNAWPIAIMNAALVFINIFQLWRRARSKREYTHFVVGSNDAVACYFLGLYEKDIKKDYPGFDLMKTDNREIHIVYMGNKFVGMLVGVRLGELFATDACYVLPEHRAAVEKKVFNPELSSLGVTRITMNMQD